LQSQPVRLDELPQGEAFDEVSESRRARHAK
jgi:hypothetical protein